MHYMQHLHLTVTVRVHVAASLCESMKKLRESPVVQSIGDIMLARVSALLRNDVPSFQYSRCDREQDRTVVLCVCVC